jgi:hypothetical protein
MEGKWKQDERAGGPEPRMLHSQDLTELLSRDISSRADKANALMAHAGAQFVGTCQCSGSCPLAQRVCAFQHPEHGLSDLCFADQQKVIEVAPENRQG